tara:strand:- start:63 stop:1058 length:996 start_codon:yes stop_codon:yes gene_type:complete
MNYSRKEVEKIEEVVKETCVADDWIEPVCVLITTLIVYFLCFYAAAKYPSAGTYLLFGFVIIRLFVIFHDLGHKSFFPTDERKNNTLGTNILVSNLIDMFALYPAKPWREGHGYHHKIHGNLNHTDVTRTVITSGEYAKSGLLYKMMYEILRFPPIFFAWVPLYSFFISHIQFGYVLYLAKLVAMYFVTLKIGGRPAVRALFISSYLAGFFGVMLFHLQHQVNEGYWKRFNNDDPYFKKLADLTGASVLKIPWFLEYFTNGIEYHDVHHFNPGVPSYKIKNCYKRLVKKGLIKSKQISYEKSFKSLFHYIYNEDTERYESPWIFKMLGLES